MPTSLPGTFDASAFSADRFILDVGDRTLDGRPGAPDGPGAHLMGILNVTPDSFSDGGRYTAVEDAVSRAAAMRSAGAAIIDVGGESTRPGADPVSEAEERDRVIPVIQALAERVPDAIVSVDTYKSGVADAALEAGAHIVNDVTGLRHDPAMAEVAADHGAPVILMHSVNEPGALTEAPSYDDVLDAVVRSLADAIERAEAAGIEHVVTDPGFGFGKSVTENLRLVNRIDRLLGLGRPVLVGVSRKSTIGAVLGTDDAPRPVDERLHGSLGATAVAVLRGATFVRTHDVAATADLLRVWHATVQA